MDTGLPRNVVFQETHIGRVELTGAVWCPLKVRLILACSCLFLAACGPGLQFNVSQEMSTDQMLQRSTHAFVGVIEKQAFENWPFFSVPGFPGSDPKDGKYWRVLRREVRIENVVKGSESRKRVDVYEIHWTGASMGDWNSTQTNERDLFLVRLENRRYHVVRDWWRSIFPISSGSHIRLPLDDSKPFWERVGLMTWWPQPDRSKAFEYPIRKDPGGSLGRWRTAKILRGLLRHTDSSLRLFACGELISWGLDQDECWETLPAADGLTPEWFSRTHHRFEQEAHGLWDTWGLDQDEARLFTTVNDRKLRLDFCRLYELRFSSKTDTGCPAGSPFPASIVTENGDEPLLGDWPHQ